MRINRSLLNWGVFLIALGGIPLAVDQGWLDPDIAGDLGQLWPLILVGIGLGLILRWTPLAWFGGALVAATFGLIFGAAVVGVRDNDVLNVQGIIPAIASTACAGDEIGAASTTESGLALADEFELDVTLSCGELTVVRAGGPSWGVEARHDEDDAPQITTAERDDASAQLRLRQDAADEFVFLGRQKQSLWDVQVPATAALQLHSTLNAVKGTIDAGPGPLERVTGTFNASDVRLDLAEAAAVTPISLDLTLNASDGHLALPAADISAAITLNASSLVVCVPAAAALRVDHSSVLGSDDLDSKGLIEDGAGQWSTPGYASAADRVSLSITNTVSSLSLERPEACS